MRVTLLPTLCFALSLISCHPRTDVQGYKRSDPVLNKAYADAHSTVQDFISELASARPDYRYLVKVCIEAQGHREHVWLEPVRYENGIFRGPIANVPVRITSLKRGDAAQATPDKISDWVILDGFGAIIAGGFTEKAMERHRGIQP